jgi:hypothetical protein
LVQELQLPKVVEVEEEGANSSSHSVEDNKQQGRNDLLNSICDYKAHSSLLALAAPCGIICKLKKGIAVVSRIVTHRYLNITRNLARI